MFEFLLQFSRNDYLSERVLFHWFQDGRIFADSIFKNVLEISGFNFYNDDLISSFTIFTLNSDGTKFHRVHRGDKGWKM